MYKFISQLLVTILMTYFAAYSVPFNIVLAIFFIGSVIALLNFINMEEMENE